MIGLSRFWCPNQVQCWSLHTSQPLAPATVRHRRAREATNMGEASQCQRRRRLPSRVIACNHPKCRDRARCSSLRSKLNQPFPLRQFQILKSLMAIRKHRRTMQLIDTSYLTCQCYRCRIEKIKIHSVQLLTTTNARNQQRHRQRKTSNGSRRKLNLRSLKTFNENPRMCNRRST